MKEIKTIGVIGAGTMGAALAQKFAQEGFTVLLLDRESRFVDLGMEKIRASLEEGLEKKVFSPQQVENTLSRLSGTTTLEKLVSCDLVVEAIFEDFKAKQDLFSRLSDCLREDTIIATNTSSFSVTELAQSVKNPSRFIGLHYFYHAAKNRLVEIVPGKETSEQTVKSAWRFCVLSGKDPIFTADAYGFAVNRFFVPWLNESARLLGEGAGSLEVIDAVSRKVFGIGMGPFLLMNATGIPVALHSQKTLEVFGPSYKASSTLEEQVNLGEQWPVRQGDFPVSAEEERTISERLLGCVFFVCSQILQEKVCSPTDLDKGARIGLKWKKGPVELMHLAGKEQVNKLIAQYAEIYEENMPLIDPDSWVRETVNIETRPNATVLVLNRPEDLNALNQSLVQQLDQAWEKIQQNPASHSVFITGSGKAFAAGADVKFFVKNMNLSNIGSIVDFTGFGQQLFDRIDNAGQKVVALVNGPAFGGGLELALCADVIIASEKAVFAFPETGIGIFPGLGGTFRTKRRIGTELALYLILSGRVVTAKQAWEIGLVDKVVSPDEMLDILSGQMSFPETREKPSLSPAWQVIERFFENNLLEEMLSGEKLNYSGLEKEEAEKICATIRKKAPIALRLADKLIRENGGASAELNALPEVFSTRDALMGLSQIGKKVEFQGQ